MIIQRATHTIDASGKVLGRLATDVAELLRGKGKVGFTYHQDHGDKVIITNADKVVLTGNKARQKKYYRHSFYPGGLTEISFEEMISSHPERVIELAVKGMLPDNRLRKEWLKRLTVKRGDN